MTKKAFTAVYNDLIQPDHFARIGAAVWLYLYLLSEADWQSGEVDGYKDRQAADTLGAELWSVRRWREKLEVGGYVVTERRAGGGILRVTVTRYKSPRILKSDGKGVQKCTPEGDKNVYPQDAVSTSGMLTSTILTKLNTQTEGCAMDAELSSERFVNIQRMLERHGIIIKPQEVGLIDDWIKEHDDDRIIQALDLSAGKSVKYADVILCRWKRGGYPKTREQMTQASVARIPEFAPQVDDGFTPAPPPRVVTFDD